MSAAATTLDIAPLIPVWAIGTLALLALGMTAVGAVRRLNGWLWRSLSTLLITAVLMNPSLVEEDREPLPDIALVIVDRSDSMEIPGRADAAEAALADLRAQAERDPDLELVEAEIGNSVDGTRAIEAIQSALAGIPRDRLAGIVLASDGRVHDMPEDVAALDIDAPVHHLLTGNPDQGDRRLVIVEAPRYGLVDEPAEFVIRVEDDAMTGTATLTFRVDGGEPQTARITIGTDTTVTAPVEHRGPNVIEIEVEPGPEELSLINNRAAVSVTGVRDRLRVLLVTGEPHNGARTWRDLLKSDPSVDLVHFTILRPLDRNDSTPVDELSLIPFPTRELFEERLEEFDLVIFDRYRRRAIMPPLYFDYIARYVDNGGALLITAGPPFGQADSLYRSPLAAVIPARPTGIIASGGFRPEVTEAGERHPVTANLAPTDSEAPWGEWFRRIDATVLGGETLLEAPDGGPLLVLARAGQGRAAVVLSDQSWLWARGYQGGGPHGEMFRRVAHWLMGEPELDEERLSAAAFNGELIAERTTLADSPPELELEWPSGRTETLDMTPTGDPGRFSATTDVTEQAGLVRLRSGNLTAVTALGPLNPLEYANLQPTAELLEPLLRETGGGAYILNASADTALPGIRRTRAGSDASGRNWYGLQRNERYIVRGADRMPLLPALLILLLIVAALGWGWRREGQ
ncbi:hypothetical protein [Hyphobacterium sp.]|jgi:hypothetical protein|uniref:hypothetical protein n=1 Tax=Hyphobacterium sp. TaxID=2004662 RepID=UPI003BA89745